MLPESLLLLINVALAFAQTRQQFVLDTVTKLSTSSLPNPPIFTLPSQDQLTITIALCSNSTQSLIPEFFVDSNGGSTSEDDILSKGHEVTLTDGLGTFTGLFPDGGALMVVSNVPNVAFEVGLSSEGPLHEVLSSLPLLGDTTSNQALLFSPPFAKPNSPKPTFPNFTLPAGNLSLPIPPSSTPNFTLFITPTSSSSLSGQKTACFLNSQQSTGIISNESSWLRDEDGWRTQWLVGGLTPATNYTAYVVQDRLKVSGPISFATKSAAFSCPLVHSLPYCPNIAYSIPLPPPPQGNFYDSSNLPVAVSQPLISYLNNFTTTLTTFACGRDLYSPLVGCDDCQREYRKWICAITFTRCGEPSPANPDSFTATPAAPSATGLSAIRPSGNGGSQQVFSALVPQETPGSARNPNLKLDTPHAILLPCLETCNAVDRACPSFLGFRCPTMQFNAAASYGVGYIDGADGSQGKGLTGTAQDNWGNVWCNSG